MLVHERAMVHAEYRTALKMLRGVVPSARVAIEQLYEMRLEAFDVALDALHGQSVP